MELLEREADLHHLEEHLRQTVAGRGRVVFLAGEAGIGKTSLTEAFCRRAADEASILRTSCDALSTPGPLAPLRDLGPALGIHLDHYAADHDGRDQLFRAVLDTLTTSERPTILVAEDAHWADGATVELLRFLARRIGERRLLTIVTYRDDEIGPNHPLRLLLGDLATASTVHRLGLLPLSEEGVRQLADCGEQVAAALHQLTGGNPFFVTEVLASGGTSVPASVGDAVLARAARLSPEARAVLDLAAVIGGSIDIDLLQRLAGSVLDEVDEGITRGLLEAGDHLAFRHELAREAILAAITSPRRRLLHARVLAALRYAPAAKRDLALLAHHAEGASDRDAVLEFAVAAAEQAITLNAHREAAAQYARALRFASALPPAERAHLFEGRSIACHFSDQREEAIAARVAALHLWRGLADTRREGDNLRWLSRVYWFDGQGAEAETAATSAVDVLESLAPDPELAMAYSNLAQLRMLDDDLAETLQWGERAIALAAELGEPETLMHALTNVGVARLSVEDERGREELERSLRLALDYGSPHHANRAMQNLAYCAMRNMRLGEADRWLDTGIAYAIEHGLDLHLGYDVATRAVVHVRQGDWSAAESEARQLLGQPMLAPVTRIVALAALGRVAARRGQPEANALLDEALALAERTGQLMRLEPVRAARAEAALLDSDPERARAEARAVSNLVFARGNRWLRGEFAWLLWQAGERDVPTAGMAEPYAMQIDGAFPAAAAAWRVLGCPYEEACALAESDDPTLIRESLPTFENLGAVPAKMRAMRRLRVLGVRDLPPVRRGPRASTRANPAGLTRREAEVLALLAEGLPTAVIAERLFLTPKTVRHYVSEILAKLGVESRVEAARIGAKLGIIPS